MKRCKLQESSESESVQKSTLGDGEFGKDSRKRRATQASRGNILPREDVELDSDDETSSLMQTLPPATKLSRLAPKTCATVSMDHIISDEIAEIEPQNDGEGPASKKKKGIFDKLLL